jgi:hypothetical protein
VFYTNDPYNHTFQLQQKLDRGGIVMLKHPRTYEIEATLKIHSNTRLICAPGVEIVAKPGFRGALIENDHFADPSERDENIEIIGGIWNGNCDAMGLDAEYEAQHRLDEPYSPALLKGKLLRFAHVDHISLEKLTVRNPVSYGIQIGDVRGFVTRDLYFDYNWHFGTTDGVHINGPARDGVIENLYGTTNDDLVSLTTYDEAHAEVSLGDIENIYIHNLSAKNGFSSVRLLSGEGYVLKNVRVDGIYGDYRHHAVVISNHNRRPGRVWFDDLVLENIHACKSATPLGEDCFRFWENGADRCPFICFDKGAICGNVTVRNVHRHQEHSTESPLFFLAQDCSIDRLMLDNIHQTTGEGATAPLWKICGKIGTLIERDVMH